MCVMSATTGRREGPLLVCISARRSDVPAEGAGGGGEEVAGGPGGVKWVGRWRGVGLLDSAESEVQDIWRCVREPSTGSRLQYLRVQDETGLG